MIVSQHAIQQWLQRTKCTGRQAAQRQLLALARKGQEVRLKPRYRLRQLLDHRCKPATYLRSSGWILVISNGVILTVHRGRADRWSK